MGILGYLEGATGWMREIGVGGDGSGRHWFCSGWCGDLHKFRVGRPSDL